MRPRPYSSRPCVGMLLTGMLVGLVASGAVEAQESSPATVRKTKNQLHFEVPPDWPIEERGGITAPIPIEEYLAMKFDALDSRLKTIEQHLNGLDLKIRVFEQMLQRQPRQGLRSSEESAP